ncbi:MAG: PQQ-binding-like beta-propeller repeat protein [Haloarculaceae archaeon]
MRHPQGWIDRRTCGETTRRRFVRATVGGGVVALAGERHAGTARAEGGEVVWTFDGTRSFHSSPTVVNGGLYIGDTGGWVYSLQTDGGAEQWRSVIGDTVQSCPTVDDGVLFLGSGDNNVYAIDAGDGSQRWRYGTGEDVFSSPTVVDGTVYVGSGDGNVYAIDAGDGSQQWQYGTGDSVFASPTVVDGTVYVGSGDGNVYAIDAGDGSQQWQYDTGGNVFSSPTVVDGTVFVGSDDGNVYAIDGGAYQPVRWQYETGDSVLSSPTVVDGTVYVGSYDGSVYALDAGLDGSSEDSRVSLGTLGHHGSWAEETTALLPASFQVAVTATNTPDAGDPLEVTVELENTGDREGTKTVEVAVDGVDSQSTPLTLDAGESTTRSFSLTTESGDGGEYTLRVSTEDDTASRTVTVSAPPSTTAPTTATSTDYETATAGPTDAETTATTASGRTTTAPGSSGGENTPILGAILVVGSGGGLLALLGTYAVFRWASGDGDSPEPERPPSDEPGADASDTGTATGSPSVPTDTPSAGDDSTPMADENRGRLHDAETNLNDTGGGRGADRYVPTEIPRAPRLSLSYEDIRKETPIGSGGQADVYRATVPTADGDVTVALKEPRMADVQQAETIKRLLAKEAETWQKIDDHDHVVGVVDWGNQPHPWIAMEYMDAGHLGDRAGELALDQALWTAIATTRAVRHAHRLGVAHLDLKPQNILFRSAPRADAWDVPKVADWGLSKQLLEHSRSIEGMSPHYAAPEQFEGDRGAADDRTDVYQLGVVFYELFTGERPFEGRPVQVMNEVLNGQPAPPSEVADVPAELDRIVRTAMATEKGDRYESVLYLRDDLQALYGSL